VELWRVLGAVIVGVGAVILTMVAIAQTRDSAALRARRGGRGPIGPAAVLRTTLLGLVLVAVTVVCVLTWVPQFVVWTLSALIWLIVGVLIFAD
jgi:hypothetical protein